MKLFVGSLIIVAMCVVIIDASKLNDTEVTTRNDENITPTISSEERRWTPVYPKIDKIIFFTTKPVFRNFVTLKRSKNPVLKIIPNKVKIKAKNFWETYTTRQPIMKYTKFTMNPSNTMNVLSKSINENEKQSRKIQKFERKYKTSLFRKIMDDEDSSEEDSDASGVNRKNNKLEHHKTWATRFHKLKSQMIKETEPNNSSTLNEGTTDKTKATKSELSSEEKEDREEFIFVTPKSIMAPKVDIEDSDESGETTTTIESELKIRQTRSINVIEEENLATTVSGFKFTGKVASLNNDLVFRNINT